MYLNAKEEIKDGDDGNGNGNGDGPVDPPIDPDQELVSFGSFTINYSYLLNLFRSYALTIMKSLESSS